MTADPPSRIEDLDHAACVGLLSRGRLGRVGISIGALPAILPVVYRWVDDQVMFLTEAESKLTAALIDAVVAFEVDALDLVAGAGWSVQIVGVASARPNSPPDPRPVLETLPWAGGEQACLVAIRPERITGRRLVMGVSGPS